MAYTHIDPGREIEVSTRLYHGGDKARVAELVKLPRTELMELEQASVAKEKAIFEKFSVIEAEWLKQAAETTALREAKEYLMALPVDHTYNQWKKDEYGNYQISNMVYKMTYRVYEQTHYDRKKQETVTDAWRLSWDLHYNTINRPTPDLTGSGWQIAGQRDKRFATKEEMERYLQGRIKAYSHLFTEISPPIPPDQKGRFCVNGVLLRGYTVEVPERTPQEVADDLLSLLEDGDLPEHPEGERPAAPPLETQATAPHERGVLKANLKTAHKKKPQPLKKHSTAPTR